MKHLDGNMTTSTVNKMTKYTWYVGDYSGEEKTYKAAKKKMMQEAAKTGRTNLFLLGKHKDGYYLYIYQDAYNPYPHSSDGCIEVG